MLDSTSYLNYITKNYSTSLEQAGASASARQATAYFLANIGNVKTIDQLLNNSRLYNYVMNAYGLADMINAKGEVKQVLEGGVSNSKALANTLNNAQLKALATAFNFVANGTATTSSTSLQQQTVQGYEQQALETQVGQNSPAVQMALYFKSQVSNITSAYNILADKTLLQVVETAYNLPQTLSLEGIDTQAQEINNVLKISDLQNPQKLQNFLDRFTSVYDAQNQTDGPTTPSSAMQVTSPGISQDLLLSLANLKLGGS